MMKVYIEKEEYVLEEGTTLKEFIETIPEVNNRGFAVGVNYCVIPKRNWGNVVLTEGVNIIIVKAVSGG